MKNYNELSREVDRIIKDYDITVIKMPEKYIVNSIIEYYCPDPDCKIKKIEKTLYNFRKNHLCKPCIQINKPVLYEMSLKNLKPEIAKFWHPTKNRFGPEHYSPGSDKKVWWLCSVINECGCLHEFEASIGDKVKTHENKMKIDKNKCCPGCPFSCIPKKKFCYHQSLEHLHPELIPFWSDKNPPMCKFLPHSNQKMLWVCNGCIHCGKIHEHRQQINSKTSHPNCVYCTKRTQYICECQNLQNKYPHLYEQWDFEKNKHIDVSTISPESKQNVDWICKKHPNQRWNTAIANRAYNPDSGCVLCGYECNSENRSIPLEDNLKEIQDIHGDKFTFPNIGEEYKNTHSIITVICDKNHEFLSSFKKLKRASIGCSQCYFESKIGNGHMQQNNDLFIELCIEAHNNLYTYEETKYTDSNAKIYVTCRKHGNFEVKPYDHLCKRSGCPKCKNKTEAILWEHLELTYPQFNPHFQFNAIWCMNEITGRYFPFDNLLEIPKIILELDGIHHFIQILNRKDPLEQQERDIYKMKCANKNEHSVIRIIQEDIYYNRYDWKTELNNAIKKIMLDNRVQNIYLCKNNEYHSYPIL